MSHETSQRRLFVFGLGYSAARLAASLVRDGWSVAGTRRTKSGLDECAEYGVDSYLFDGTARKAGIAAAVSKASHVLSSVPPDVDGDPVLRHHGPDISANLSLIWVGYLSTTAVYGDTGGAWVDEASPVSPTGERGRRRVAAELGWRALGAEHGLAVNIFRLAGIYGPGRSALDQVRNGTARRIVKPGQVFSRIHVDDIVAVLRASMARPEPGTTYNVCDDLPAPAADVIAYACRLLGVPPPPEVPFEAADLSPMARSFYADCRRVRNDRVKQALGVGLAFPDYRAGLRDLFSRGL